MEYLIGAGLALAVCTFALLVGFDRDRVFYPTVLAVVGSYYVLFAVMGGSMSALAIESVVACAFLILAAIGFRKNLWLVAVALAGHGVFDFVHRFFIQNLGVPAWWPGICFSFDVIAGGFLAVLLTRRSGSAELRKL